MLEKLNLFKKTMKGENGTKWYSYFATNSNGQAISVRLSEDARNQVLASGIDFPLEIDIDDNDYFITTETRTNNDGLKLKYTVCVITSFTKIAKADIKKQTLSDFFNSKPEEFDIDYTTNGENKQ